MEEMLEALKEDSVGYINKICSIIHKSVIRYGGIIVQQQHTEFLIVWENNSVICGSSQYIDGFSDFIKGGIPKRISSLAFLAFYQISTLL